MKWDADTKLYTPCNGEQYFSEEEIRTIMLDTIEGLKYLHSIGVMHRDIKPHNLLMTSAKKIKICDFGVACKVESKEKDTLTNTEGTYHFMPPECWNYDIREFSGVKADMWALGVTLYAIVYNKMPFWADNELELANVIMKDEIDFNQDRDVSLDLKHLIQKLLSKDPDKRPSTEDLLSNDEFLLKSEE